jgi:hypothetical protein
MGKPWVLLLTTIAFDAADALEGSLATASSKAAPVVQLTDVSATATLWSAALLPSASRAW